jgi:hypothetical protein
MIRSFLRKPFNLFVLVFLGQWLLLFWAAAPTWDAVFYYTYGRSAIFDQDLDLINDFQLAYDTASPDFIAKEYHTDLTERNRVASPFAIGSSLLWSPLIVLVKALGKEGWAGFERPFIIVISTFSSLIGFLSIWLSYRLTRRQVDGFSAVAAGLTLMFATPLIHYQFRAPMYSHTASALLTTLVVYAWWHTHRHPGTTLQAIRLGALVGLAGLMRWQNVMYIALPIVSTLWWWLALPAATKRLDWRRGLVYLLGVGATAVFIFSLQMAVWWLFYGTAITVPQGNAFTDWRAAYLWPTLFSTFHGLFTWMPASIFALIGLIYLGKRQPRLIVPLGLIFALEVYVNSSTADWFAGGGFGPRRFTSELAILLLGYAGFLQMITSESRRVWRSHDLQGFIHKTLQGLAVLLSLGLVAQQWLLLRFGIPDHLGGGVVSMYPHFEWHDISWAAFGRQLVEHIPRNLNELWDVLVFPHSPLYMAWQGVGWPQEQVIGLVGTAVFLLITLAIGRAFNQRWGRWYYGWVVGTAVLVLALNVWILVWA